MTLLGPNSSSIKDIVKNLETTIKDQEYPSDETLDDKALADKESKEAPEEPAAPPEEIPDDAVLPEVLTKVPLFAGLLPAHLRRMATVSTFMAFKKNDYVFRHGDDGDGLYIVHAGSIRISRNASGMGEEALAIIRDGGHFGEMSLIDIGGMGVT